MHLSGSGEFVEQLAWLYRGLRLHWMLQNWMQQYDSEDDESDEEYTDDESDEEGDLNPFQVRLTLMCAVPCVCCAMCVCGSL